MIPREVKDDPRHCEPPRGGVAIQAPENRLSRLDCFASGLAMTTGMVGHYLVSLV
jgi:hypothetical protein